MERDEWEKATELRDSAYEVLTRCEEIAKAAKVLAEAEPTITHLFSYVYRLHAMQEAYMDYLDAESTLADIRLSALEVGKGKRSGESGSVKPLRVLRGGKTPRSVPPGATSEQANRGPKGTDEGS